MTPRQLDQLAAEAIANDRERRANAAAACSHRRQMWSIGMRTGHCQDCGAVLVYHPSKAPPPALPAAFECERL